MLNIRENESLSFYECCILVNGQNRAIILDLNRNEYVLINQHVYYLFIQNDNYVKASDIYSYSKLNDVSFDVILAELIESEFVFVKEVEEIKSFPKISRNLETSEIIRLCEIIVSEYFKKNCDSILLDLANLGCETVVLYFDHFVSFKELEEWLSHFSNLSIINIIVYIKYHKEIHLISAEDYLEFYTENNSLSLIVCHSCTTQVGDISFKNMPMVACITSSLDDTENFKVDSSMFVVSTSSVIESMSTNLYYNKRIGINRNGNICKSIFYNKASMGQFCQDRVLALIQQEKFSELWNTSKDDIEYCNKCEFRYICVDPRIPVFEKSVYFEEPCGYNIFNFKGI